MTTPQTDTEPLTLEIPETRRGPSLVTVLAAGAVIASAAGYGLWRAGVRPSRLWATPEVRLAVLPVDEGEMVSIITENGSLESANNAQIRCQVEALIGVTGGGMAGGARGGGGGGGGGRGGGGGGGGRGGMGGAGGGQGGANGGQQPQAQPAPVAKKAGAVKGRAGSTAKKAGTSASKTATAGTSATAATTGGATSGGGMGAGGGGGGGAVGGATASTGTTPSKKPMIRSFTYMVVPHMPLRPKSMTQTTTAASAVDPMMGGGGGGRRGGGGGGMGMEKPGATRIISIVPEGKKVKPGDVVIELDSSAFKDEVQAQEIRYAQAKAWVEQAAAILDVNLITEREYRDGIFPQDAQLVRQYLVSCRTDEQRARKNYLWAVETEKKGFRSAAQTQADQLALKQAEFALSEAEGMAVRLDKYTAPKILKNLAAKIEAIKADKLAQEAAFQLEADRLKRLKKTVENCTIRAPREGIVVYYTSPNMWGRTEDRIQEGVTVREGQILVELPDPKNMRVRAKVNESKVSLIHAGQRAEIVLDAFPDQPLMGTVEGVTAIPSAAGGPVSDVKVYVATVAIDPGTSFDGLRPGMSAEVSFLVKAQKKVTRVPVQAIRWVNNKPFAAVSAAGGSAANDPAAPSWAWRSVSIGQTTPNYAEVVSGLEPGDQVVARPDLLPAPRPEAAPDAGKPAPPAVAGAAARPLG